MFKLIDASFLNNGISGIYLIVSPSGKKYVGQSMCIKKRLIDHKCPSRKYLQNSISIEFKKYSLDLFLYEILEVCEPSKLNEREIFWINKINPELNKSSGGYAHSGCCVSDEIKAKLSEAGKNQWLKKTSEEKQRIVNENLTGRKFGFNHSAETKRKISKSLLGRKQSIDSIEKRSKSVKISMIGNKNGNKKVASYLNGVKVKEFESIVEAAKFLNIHPAGITKAVKGYQNTAGGYSWKFIGEGNE